MENPYINKTSFAERRNIQKSLQLLIDNSHHDIEIGLGRDYAQGRFAFELNNLWRLNQAQGESKEFINAIVDNLPFISSNLPEPLRQKGEIIGGYQQPSLPEAIQETAKRLLYIETFLENLPSSVNAVFLGGSMSYGRFYNIRGGSNPSDIDINLIVEPEFFTNADCKNLLEKAANFNASEVDEFLPRAKVFPSLLKDGKADMLSTTGKVDDYSMRINFFTVESFIKLFCTDIYQAMKQNENTAVLVNDFREEGRRTNLTITDQFNFMHQSFDYPITSQKMEEGGQILTLPHMLIQDGHVYMGRPFNQANPMFEIEYDADGLITQANNIFKSILKLRLEKERTLAADPSLLEVPNAHPRRALFSPQAFEYSRTTVNNSELPNRRLLQNTITL